MTSNYSRKHIHDIPKELRKRKIDPKRNDPGAIDILGKPIQKDGVYLSYVDQDFVEERLKKLDDRILSNIKELEETLTSF